MISEGLMRLGGWEVSLLPEAPQEVVDALEFFGHVAFIPGRVDVRAYEDELLTMARYVGVVRSRQKGAGGAVVGGSGMAYWLGDEDDKGAIYETAKTFSGATFANTIRDLLPASVSEGTLHSVPGSYTGSHVFVTPKNAINYVASTFGAEWRVNGDGSLDAGLAEDLWQTEPTSVIVRRGAGRDFTLRAVDGDLATEVDTKLFSTRVVILAEGEGDSIATGSADLAANPYLDLFGNPVVKTRLVSESETSSLNADARAQLQLNRFSGTRKKLDLSTGTYEVEGEFRAGDTVYVYDPDQGLFDLGNEVQFRGDLIYPLALQVTVVEFPVQAGMTVAYRAQDGSWIDVSDHVDYETGGAKVTVGGFAQTLSSASEPVGDRPNRPAPGLDDGIAPARLALGTPSSWNYQDAKGETRSALRVPWSEPLNTDGSTITDGGHYEVRIRLAVGADFGPDYVAGEPGEWTGNFVGWDEDGHTFQPLDPGVPYEVQGRAVDLAGNAGDWSDSLFVVAQPDAIPPSTPAPPSTVAGNPFRIQVTHTLGKATGGAYNLESDIAYLEVYVGTSAAFALSPSLMVGTMVATGNMVDLLVPAVGTFDAPGSVTRYVKVIAVDRAGNKSIGSGSSTVTATLVDTIHVTDAAITNAKIANLAVTQAKIADLAVGTAQIASAAITNAKIGSLAVDTAQIATAAITNAKVSDLSASKITAGTISATIGIQSPVISGGSITGTVVTGGTLQTAGSGNNRVVITSSPSEYVSFWSSANQLRGRLGWNPSQTRIELDATAGTASNLLLLGDSTRVVSSFGDLLLEGAVSAGSTSACISFRNGTAEVATVGANGKHYAEGAFLVGNELALREPSNTTQRIGLRAGDGGSGLELQSRVSSFGGVVSTSAYNGYAGTFFRVVSSERYKEGIEDAPLGAMDLLRSLHPVQFRYRDVEPEEGQEPEKPRAPGRLRRGFIAEELPEGLREGDGYDLSKLLAIVVQALQELDARTPGPPSKQ